MPSSQSIRQHRWQLGFTLIEVIIGIVVLSISMSVVISLIVPTEQQSADQIHQIKAAELGQGLLDEILGRAFDENSDHAGGHWRCDETARPVCSLASTFGANQDAGEATRDQFDDVDDYHGFSDLVNSTNTGLDSGYDSFELAVNVVYDGAALGLANGLAKKVTVTVTTPLKLAIVFAGYKANF
jgi:MSHA pilin protein MshD